MAGLSEMDRHAVVLRFFDGCSMSEVGMALGASEDAAKKRVNRAVEKLRGFFTKRGVVLPAAVLMAAISANSVQAAPAVLVKTATAVALAKGAAASTSTLTLIKGALKVMAWTKAKTAVVVGIGLIIAAGGTTIVVKKAQAHRQQNSGWRRVSPATAINFSFRPAAGVRLEPVNSSTNISVVVFGADGSNGNRIVVLTNGVSDVQLQQLLHTNTKERKVQVFIRDPAH
jgi:hypothetical protein